MEIKIIKIQHLTPSKWEGGKTFEYYIYPENAQYKNRDFDFRISSATIDKAPSLFTRFNGYHRYLVMLDNSLEIIKNGKKERYSAGEIVEFNAADEIQSFSLGNDFNLMIKEESRGKTTVGYLEEVKTNNEFTILFALHEGEVILNKNTFSLKRMDCMVVKNPKNEKIILTGTANCLVISR